MNENINKYGDTKQDIIDECDNEIAALFNNAIGVHDTIWYTMHCTLFDAIMIKLEEIL